MSVITLGMLVRTVTSDAKWNNLEGTAVKLLDTNNWMVQLTHLSEGDLRCFRDFELQQAGGPW